MSSTYNGKSLKLSIFGQSHSAAIGCVLDGLPPGFKPDMEKVAEFMARRAPGQNSMSTARKEADKVNILSGLAGGVTCGAPLSVVIENTDTRSQDYASVVDCPRPAHADYPAYVKYGGFADFAGGGHFSGRLTAPICAVGAILLQYLESKGITIAAHIGAIGNVNDEMFDMATVDENALKNLLEKKMPTLSDDAGIKMEEEIAKAKAEGDSVGGIIECAVVGLPVGLGDPMFDGMENRIAAAAFAIPAVKGIEFGAGFEVAKMRGTQNNDSYRTDGQKIWTETNNHGGILGGITTGMPLVFRMAFKPTPSIGLEQDSISLERMENQKTAVKGRHDPCVVVRAVPCVEAIAALVIADFLI